MSDVTPGRAHTILVRAPRSEISRVFGALVALQPMRWRDDGLVCAPWLTPDHDDTCPLPTEAIAPEPVVPDSPAALVAGWYRRTDRHAPAPDGVRELVQTAGEGFGPADHPTTAMCLRAIDGLPGGPAIDAGCGSGLLAQAWAASGRGPVDAVDADPAAVAQAVASARAAGVAITVTRGRIERLDPARIARATLLANLPPAAHDALAARLDAPPPAAVLSGFTRRDRDRVLTPYRRTGMRPVRAMRAGRYECHVMMRR